jgi:DNA-directed RNA polymerase specialized sigma24 family protein
MDAPPWKSEAHGPEVYSDETIRVSYVRITRACVCAGLNPADSEDLAQDIWMWMLRVGVPIALIATPWLKAVVRNHVLRFRRRDYSHRVREGRPLETVPEPAAGQPEGVFESNDLLDRVAVLLPKRERGLLALIRRGYSLPEASRVLGIPAGSRDYYQGRIIAYARRAMKRPVAIPIRRGSGDRNSVCKSNGRSSS